MAEQVLEGIKVLDLTHCIAGPFCTKLLADYGSEVIKIERPGEGDMARQMGPFPKDIPDPEKSGLFLYLNTNKKGITLNLKAKTAVDIFLKLIAWADVLVENFSPRVLPGLGLSYKTLKKVNPKLVMTSISSFGQTGPYRDWKATELTLTALSGIMHKTGDPEREPLKYALHVFQYLAGKIAGTVTLAAVIKSDLTGKGNHIDLSILETVIADVNNRIATYGYSGDLGERAVAKNYGDYPFGGFPAQDGYVALQGIGRGEEWMLRLFEMIGHPELKEDPNFSTRQNREMHMDELNALLYSWLVEHTKQEVFDEAARVRYPAGPVYDTSELVNNPHYRELGFFIPIDHPQAGKLEYPGAPLLECPKADMKSEGRLPCWDSIMRKCTAVCSDFKRRTYPYYAGEESSNMTKIPDLVREDLLTGVRVVELGEAVVGPWAGLLLADLGAQVIKVESINRTDLSRGPISIKGPVPFFEDYPDGKLGDRPWNRTARYNTYNIGKLGITLDLAKPLGVQAFLKIVQVSDVLLTNMALGVAEKMGLGYQEVCAVNPKIIYLSATGFGRKGPYAKRMTMGNVIDGASGMFGLRDYGDGDSTAVTPSIHCDTTAASTNAFAIMAALYHRKKTGKGLFIDVSMVESGMSHIGEAIMDYTMNQRVQPSLGNRDDSMSPQGCYRSQGADEWVTLSIANDQEWKRLTELMGSPGLAEDERFTDVLGRVRNQDALDPLLEAWTEQHTKFEVMEQLQEKGIACGAVYNNADVYHDPHLQARKVLEEIDHPEAGKRSYVRRLWQLEEAPETQRRHAPLLGQHTEFVLESIAGLTPEEIMVLKQSEIIGTEPVIR